jgi:hypothetical protein
MSVIIFEASNEPSFCPEGICLLINSIFMRYVSSSNYSKFPLLWKLDQFSIILLLALIDYSIFIFSI